VFNPALFPPEGEVDVLGIISSRRHLEDDLYNSHDQGSQQEHRRTSIFGKPIVEKGTGPITPGYGWQLFRSKPGYCDGSYNAVCGREPGDKCLLSGHEDSRGGILGNCLSGWLVMDLKDVKHGIIILKIETYHNPNTSTRTAGWIEVNDGKSRKLQTFPDTFAFDYAIDGRITTLDRHQYKLFSLDRRIGPNVDILQVMDDPTFPGPKDVEVGIRMRGCGRNLAFSLSHVYWG